MPKVLKMRKPPPKAEKTDNRGTRDPAPVSKTTPIAEIIFFPNGRNGVPFVPGISDDPETETRWLGLAADALDRKRTLKNA